MNNSSDLVRPSAPRLMGKSSTAAVALGWCSDLVSILTLLTRNNTLRWRSMRSGTERYPSCRAQYSCNQQVEIHLHQKIHIPLVATVTHPFITPHESIIRHVFMTQSFYINVSAIIGSREDADAPTEICIFLYTVNKYEIMPTGTHPHSVLRHPAALERNAVVKFARSLVGIIIRRFSMSAGHNPEQLNHLRHPQCLASLGHTDTLATLHHPSRYGQTIAGGTHLCMVPKHSRFGAVPEYLPVGRPSQDRGFPCFEAGSVFSVLIDQSDTARPRKLAVVAELVIDICQCSDAKYSDGMGDEDLEEVYRQLRKIEKRTGYYPATSFLIMDVNPQKGYLDFNTGLPNQLIKVIEGGVLL
ncbi:hypothetical protein VP01_575g2 [Puccinia sorghi]|uniref:Uncharacterized protein n=1 Tax=Puccinia sorghi TaxID=27349 RepID=A0A0L6UID4_9BASI|nr:hypothetical protein VP01_575g2 [Puccinia sorghi]